MQKTCFHDVSFRFVLLISLLSPSCSHVFALLPGFKELLEGLHQAMAPDGQVLLDVPLGR